VMSHAFACHTALGRLADEQIYTGDFASRLSQAEIGAWHRNSRFSRNTAVTGRINVRGFVGKKISR